MATKKENSYYVYEWYNVDTGIVFYVGKGTGVRYKSTDGRNDYFRRYIAKHNCKSRKIIDHLLEDEAYRIEVETIAKYKLKDECMCNFHVGGKGGASNRNLPEDTVVLKTMSLMVNKSQQLIGSRGRPTFGWISNRQERALVSGFQQHGLYTPEDYYDLPRDKKIEIGNDVMDFLEEEDYNDEAWDVINEGGAMDFDDYWSHIYKD
jgi:hypothetical protein